MHLYRKVVPKIAREVIRLLSTGNMIELDDGKQDEAELDLAAIMVEYLNSEDRVVAEARDLMARRGLGHDRLAQVKKSIAQAKGLKIGDEGLDYVLEQLVEALFASKNVAEVFAEDNELRVTLREVLEKYLSIPEEVDKEARMRLKNLREGTPEWEIEYPRAVAQVKRIKGLA